MESVPSPTNKQPGLIARIADKCKEAYAYMDTGVWREPRETLWIRIVKILSLSIRPFSNRDLQIRSMALTYTTVLAIVPAFALLFAIARGFGFQNILQDQITHFIPSQQETLETALGFVDSYLKQASQGVFVGAGVILLLWTLISLLSSMEDAFNNIWGIQKGRSFYRKITDYLTALVLIPILMVCSSSVSIFISGLNDALGLAILTPLVNTLLDVIPFLLTWIAFTLTFMLMPNTKVQFKYAALSGFLCMIGFQVLQWLFFSGQIYVSKYNAIYGSFAFLPLMLIWLQFSWLIILFGCLLTFSMQNVTGFNYLGTVDQVSTSYMKKISFVVGAIVFNRAKRQEAPLSVAELAATYQLPVSLVNIVTESMFDSKILYRVECVGGSEGLAPAVNYSTFTVAAFFETMGHHGDEDFIPRFSSNYAKALETLHKATLEVYGKEHDLLLQDVPVEVPPPL